MKTRLFPLLSLTLALGACSYLPAVGPSYKPVKLNLPAAYLTPQPGATSPTIPYWERLNDATLNKLEQQAIAQNLSLKQGWQRIQQARAQSAMALAGFGPQVQGQGSLISSRVGADANPYHTGTFTSDTYNLSLGASWEVDLFGGQRRALEASKAQTEMQKAATAGIRSALTAEVARAYLTYRTLQNRLAVVTEQVSTSEHRLSLLREQKKVGLINGLTLAGASAAHNQLAMQRPALQSALSSTQFGLENLLGQQPGTLAATLNPTPTTALPAAAPSLPPVPTSSSLVLPSTLLTERPDLILAENRVKAATAQIGVATSELFPKFSLTGSYGIQTADISHIDSPAALIWNGGPGFRWTLFATGQILQNIRLTKAAQRESILAYQQSVLNALADVETQLTANQAAQETLALATEQAKNLSQTKLLADAQHTQGLINGIMWDQQKIQALQGEDLRLQTHLQALNAYISLHQALGL